MRNLLTVARHEFFQTVRRRAFLITTVGLPLFIAAIMALSILVAEGATGDLTIGYVDGSGVLSAAAADELTTEDGEPIALRHFESVEAGRDAVSRGEVRALFVVGAAYPTSDDLTVYYAEDQPTPALWERWNRFVRASLVSDEPEGVAERLLEGSRATIMSADGSRALQQGDVVGIILPIVVAVLFMIVSMSSSGYLLQALVSEKENRTVEILVSSVSPAQLIVGKALGLMAVSLLQLTVWIVTAGVALVIAAPLLGDIPQVSIPWGLLGAVLVYFLPAYALLAGAMIGIGGIVSDSRQGQSLSAPFTLPFVLPIMLMPLILSNSESPVLVFMTLFPLTSFLTVTVRLGFASVPFWQMALSWGLLVATAGGVNLLSAAIFRLGMLRYGQRLELRQIVAGLRRRAAAES